MNIDELYSAYFNDVYRFIFSLTKNRSLTEDIVQETFTRAFLNMNSYRNPPNKAWLFTVSRHMYYDHLRKNKKTADVDYDFSMLPDSEVTPEDQLFRKENIQNLQKEIMNLKDRYRDAIRYVYIEELNYKEAAAEMDVTVSNFKSIVFRAKRKLKRALEGKDEPLE
ncbi:RNA polymerase sigma factor SigM [Lentibacillus sp. JNUCC-1]|uniref:RNA polymerase sigma factor n=1 Tax=Lentibacillus sp. JNUCC-1 TaxID=2654513 RepID=UPI0012E829C3|nr:RNA polymerase sigma factor [Lentibacillus sp. JNUCC-1]MUV37673.1 RNA polymerase sigma factor SigM [Lentibacillus sp. JNUCC-1]